MKKTFTLLLYMCLAFVAKAQQHYFIYLQTDNKQAFSVKANGKQLSSSASGYLVLSKLKSGDQSFVISFPKDQWAKQSFNVRVNDADAGYLLKNFGEKGWGLFNMQNMDIVMSGTAPTKQKPKTAITDDEFEKTLAGASNTEIKTKTTAPKPTPVEEEPTAKVATSKADRAPVKEIKPEPVIEEEKTIAKVEPAIIEKTVPKQEPVTIEKQIEKEPETVTKKIEEQPIIENKAEKTVEPIVTNEIANSDEKIANAHKNDKITKLNTYNDDDGVTITYKIKSDAGTDIVPIFIEREKTVVAEKENTIAPEKEKSIFVEEESPTAKVASNKADRAPLATKKQNEETPVEEQKPVVEKPEPVEIKKETIPQPKEEPVVKTEPVKEITTTTSTSVVSKNTDCTAQATEDDFFKTRKKMVAEDSDDAMIEVAAKLFKVKCYSVEQIKNLSLLFLNDNGKYKLFDAAYPYTNDTNNFASLEAQLKEPYFIKRFKAMLDR
jgi:hypothetical protein